MPKNLKISDMSVSAITESLKIPVGGFGDLKVSVASLRRFFEKPSQIFQTTNPDIYFENGVFQELTLELEVNQLTANIPVGRYVFIRVNASNNQLYYSAFNVVNQFYYTTGRNSYILLINTGNGILLLGCQEPIEFIGSPDPFQE